MSSAPEPPVGRRRGSSLTARFPGDKSHRPLDIIRKDNKLANRAPHLKKKYLPGPDTVDSLDNIGAMGAYHHEGPYDATLLSRNISSQISPVAAARGMNEEALRATPKEIIHDSLHRHRPLDRVGIVPPGGRDLSGRTMDYQEGANLMIEDGGNYKRWPGVTYLPGDVKGKGEPSYSVDQALASHKQHSASRRNRASSSSQTHRRVMSDTDNVAGEYEMTSCVRPASSGHEGATRNGGGNEPDWRASTRKSYREWEEERQRNATGASGGGVAGGLKRGLGSLRLRKHRDRSSIS